MRRLDTEKAAAIINEAGMSAERSGAHVFGHMYRGSLDHIMAGPHVIMASVDGIGREASAMEALAARLLTMAAICRRIEAEAITETPS